MCVLLLAVVLGAGCASFTWTTASIPYLGDIAPETKSPDTPWELAQLQKLEFPGLTVRVRLCNEIDTFKMDVLFGVPVPRDVADGGHAEDGDGFSVVVCLAPAGGGFTFDPALAEVVVDGRPHAAESAILVSGDQVKGRSPLVPGQEQVFVLIFATPTPGPDQNIDLRLGQAVSHPDFPPLPEIHFISIRTVFGKA